MKKFKEWWRDQIDQDSDVWNESSEFAGEQCWDAGAAYERERCARICEALVDTIPTFDGGREWDDSGVAMAEAYDNCAKTIRQGLD
jgi:hypothetical protein